MVKNNLKTSEKWEQGEIYQEKQSFQKYLRDSTRWQNYMLYIGAASAMILLGIFIVLVQISL